VQVGTVALGGKRQLYLFQKRGETKVILEENRKKCPVAERGRANHPLKQLLGRKSASTRWSWG